MQDHSIDWTGMHRLIAEREATDRNLPHPLKIRDLRAYFPRRESETARSYRLRFSKCMKTALELLNERAERPAQSQSAAHDPEAQNALYGHRGDVVKRLLAENTALRKHIEALSAENAGLRQRIRNSPSSAAGRRLLQQHPDLQPTQRQDSENPGITFVEL